MNGGYTREERKRVEAESYAIALRQRAVFPFVKIATMDDARVCDHCREIASRIYRTEAAPVPPHDGCTSARGCQCMLIPVSRAALKTKKLKP